MSTRTLAVIVVFCCTATLAAQKKDPYKKVDTDVRLESLRHAQVWTDSPIASKDIKAGPPDAPGFRPEAVVTCEYVEKKQTGTPKFDCALDGDDEIRVKYGDENGEIYSEVARDAALMGAGIRRRPCVSRQGRLHRMPRPIR